MVLASQSVPGSSVPGSPGFVGISFATPPTVVAGTQYAIVAYSSTNSSNAYGWSYSGTANPYAGGVGLYTLTSPPSGAWNFFLEWRTLRSRPTSGCPLRDPRAPLRDPPAQRAARPYEVQETGSQAPLVAQASEEVQAEGESAAGIAPSEGL